MITSSGSWPPWTKDDRRRAGHRGRGVFDLDFHAVMHWGRDPRWKSTTSPRAPSAPGRADLLRPDTGTHNLVYANADLSKATQAREVIAFCDHWSRVRRRPEDADHDQKVTTQEVLGELNEHGVKFATLRMRSRSLVTYISSLAPADYTTITLDRPGPHNRPKVHEDPAVKLTSYPGTVRQLIITGLAGTSPPSSSPTTTSSRPGHLSSNTPADDHRAAAGRDHPRVLRRRPVLHRQPQRRPRRDARRPAQALIAALRVRCPVTARLPPTPSSGDPGNSRPAHHHPHAVTVRSNAAPFHPSSASTCHPLHPSRGARPIRYEIT